MFKKKNKLTKLEETLKEYIKELRCTREEFIKKATHRSVLDIELLIDIDEAGEFASIKEKAQNIVKKLDHNNVIHTIYFSGSKSYHISILMPELREQDPYKRSEIKRDILSSLGADTQKASNRNMIALEGESHWKTGKQKLEVKL